MNDKMTTENETDHGATAAAQAEKPAVIDAATFVREGYAAKIAAGECFVWRNSHRDEQIITIRKSGFDNCPIEVIRPYDTGIYESASIDEASYEVQWLPLPSSPAPASEAIDLSTAERARMITHIEGLHEAHEVDTEKITALENALDEILQHADADVGGCDEINDADNFIDLLAGRLYAIRRLALDAATAAPSDADGEGGG